MRRRSDYGLTNKPISRKKWNYAVNELLNGRMTAGQASKYIGISGPTFKKWFDKMFFGETLPYNLFIEDEDGETE